MAGGRLCRWFDHRWKTTIYNVYAVSIEERCERCKAMRWHSMEHKKTISSEPDWQQGPHPSVKRAV